MNNQEILETCEGFCYVPCEEVKLYIVVLGIIIVLLIFSIGAIIKRFKLIK